MKRVLSFVALVAFAGVRAPADEPKAEVWVAVGMDRTKSFRVRVDGGPPKQVEAPFEEKEDKRWKNIPGVGRFGRAYGFLSPDGKKALYHEEEPDAEASKKITDFQLIRIMLVDADGKNPKVMLNNVIWWPGFRVCPDGKSVVCVAAEAKEKWYPFRVTFDGSKPTKLSETVSLYPPAIVPLLNDRFVYCPITKMEEVKSGPFTTTATRGPAILIDRKKETVLAKETPHTPEVSQDATKMAHEVRNDKGEAAIEITDLKTGKKEEIPLKVFNKDWKCQFRQLKFSPDGKALVVTFFLGGVVIRQKGPLPGDEAQEHFGVIWLDGRKDRTALFRVDQPRDKNGYFESIREIEWSSAPPAKK